MKLKEQIMADVKSAMKNKEQDRLSVLRFVHSQIKNREIDMRPNEISEEDVLGVLKKLVKQRQDSIDQFSKAGRTDLMEKEQYELGVIESYLPAAMSKEDVEKACEEAIASLQATSIKDMGKVMKEVMTKTQGAADNRLISEIVKTKLQ